MNRRSVMIQGTSSDAGKSMLVTALCRWLKRRGIAVAPFKPQNMALNSAVSIDGGEIGRAQAVQAFACGIAASTDMNPILLKPNSDRGSQVIIDGKPIGNMDAVQYHAYKKTARQYVLKAHERLTNRFDRIIIEGAGSPAEVNLRDNDIANMGFAEAIDCPVILIADIDKGGVFAHIVGTLDLLSESERNRVVGIVINRFRGDLALLQPGIDWLESYSGKPVLGVLPYMKDFYLEAEDSIANFRMQQRTCTASNDALRIAVIALPKISNHTDFDPLQLHPGVQLQFVSSPIQLEGCELIILPGSKNTRDDLAWLCEQQWPSYIYKHLRYNGKVVGICGGFQMLGKHVHDPSGVEGEPGSSIGLGLLDMETELSANKLKRNISGELTLKAATFNGYEIHMGRSYGAALVKPALRYANGADGAISIDNQVLGCYVHGLFDHPQAADALLDWAGLQEYEAAVDMHQLRTQSVESLADMVELHLNQDRLCEIFNLTPCDSACAEYS